MPDGLVTGEDPLLGAELGRFRLTRLLGKGGMGRVYLGVQPTIGSRVAIKVLAEEYADSPELLERFFTEARAVNLIHHENIVAITDLDRTPAGRPFIVMEFVEGQTLRQLAEAKTLPLGGVLDVIAQSLDALHAAHEAGIVHRDLKPDNIIVTTTGRAKVLDFGIAKLVDRPGTRTATGVKLGTPHYMAPEQILTRDCDGRTDVYAAGIMLFELVTGARPFEGDSDFELMELHLRAPRPSARRRIDGVSETLDAVIRKAIAVERDERFASAAEMALAVRAARTRDLPDFTPAQLKPVAGADVAGAVTSVATPAADGTRSQPTVREGSGRVPDRRPPASVARRPWVLLGAVAAAAGVGAGIVGLAGRGDSQDPAPPMVAVGPVADARADGVDATVAVVAPDAEVVLALPDSIPDAAMDAAMSGGKPNPYSVRATDPGPKHRCTGGSQCPNFQCFCKQGARYGGECKLPGGVCLTAKELCTHICSQGGGFTGRYAINSPITEADCAAATPCKTKGVCSLKRERSLYDNGLVCVKDCSQTASCTMNGRCTDGPDHTCVATSTPDCERSIRCKDAGLCVIRDGECAVSAAACRASRFCAVDGRCTAVGSECVTASQADCEGTLWCKDMGRCTFKDGTCVE